jgi:hypothetical protein
MVRRLLHLIALLALVLSGPAQGLLMAGAPPAACCCCGGEAQDPSPCGMPKAPCAPRCPSGASLSTVAPVTQVSRTRAAQTRKAAPRKEPAPWPAAAVRAGRRSAFLEAAPAHAPPLPPRRDPQAALSQFRI